MTVFTLFRRQVRADRAALGAVAAVVLVSAFLAAALPRQLNRVYDDALRTVVAEAPAAAREVRAGAPGILRPARVDRLESRIRRTMQPPLRSRIGDSTNAATTQLYTVRDAESGIPYLPVSGPGAPTPTHFLDLRYQSEFAERVRVVAGRLPGAGTKIRSPEGRVRLVEVALAADAARRMDYRIGQTFLLSPVPLRNSSARSLAIRVTGLFEPLQPAADYWRQNGRVLDPAIFLNEGGTATLHEGVALMDRAGVSSLVAFPSTATLGYEWHFPVSIDTLDAGSVSALSRALNKITATAFATGEPGGILGRVPPATVQSGLDTLLSSFLDQQTTATAVMSLVVAGVLGVALIVIALAVQLLPERRRAAVRLTGARGASTAQVVSVLALEAVLLAAPAAAVGWAVAGELVDARPAWLSTVLVVTFAVVTIGLVCAGGWLEMRRARTDRGNSDVAATRLSPQRVAAEALIGALALVGVVLLRRRGLATSAGEAGIDPLLATVPLLLGLAAGLVLLRVVPLPLRALLRLARARSGAVPFLGIARVARSTATGVLPVLVVLLGLAVAVFSSVVDTTVTQGQRTSAWQQVGADYRVDSFGFEPDWIAQVAATEGVDTVAPVYREDDADVAGGRDLTSVHLLALDPAQYAEMLRGAPYSLPGLAQLTAPAVGEPLPAVVSSRVAGVAPGETAEAVVAGSRVPIRVVATAGSAPVVPADEPFVVLPLDALREASGDLLRPTTLLLTGAPGVAEPIAESTRGFAAGASVSSRREVLSALTDAPLVEGTQAAFRVGTVAAGVYSLLAVLLTLVLTARPRSRTLSNLRTLGLTRRQATGVATLETLPLVVVAAAAGVALGAAIPRLLGPAIDLRPFTGGGLTPGTRLDPVEVVVLAGGLLGLVLLAVALVGFANRRANLGAALRGDDHADA